MSMDERYENMKKTLAKQAEQHGSALLPRTKVGEYTGGTMTSGFMSMLDSQGLGPKGAFKIGRNIVYDVPDFNSWLLMRSTEAYRTKLKGQIRELSDEGTAPIPDCWHTFDEEHPACQNCLGADECDAQTSLPPSEPKREPAEHTDISAMIEAGLPACFGGFNEEVPKCLDCVAQDDCEVKTEKGRWAELDADALLAKMEAAIKS